MSKLKQPNMHRRAVLNGVVFVGAASCQAGIGGRAAAAPVSARATVSADGVMHVPAHDIPMPTSISQQARGYLMALATRKGIPGSESANRDDAVAVRKRVAAYNSIVGGYFAAGAAASRTSVEAQGMGGVPVFVAWRNEATPAERSRINLNMHGGGFVYGGGRSVMYDAQLTARKRGGTVISIDYRMPPDHPYPAAPDDCLAVYRAVLERYGPSKLLVSGSSAGGNLAAVLMHKARDAGLPPPAALVLDTPITDFSTVGDSRSVNAYVDVLLNVTTSKEQESWVLWYVGGADVSSPYLSPLRGDLSRGFPPTYLRSGTRDLLLSDTVRMHTALRRAGIVADLYVGEGMPHGGFPSVVPEGGEADADLERWLDRHWRI